VTDKSIYLENILSSPWEQKLTNDILSELERYSGEKRSCIEEMRRFLAVKGYRDLLSRLEAACKNTKSFEALRAAAHTMRSYALERPGMSAATFRTPTTDTAEWRAAVDSLRAFMTGILSECGLRGKAADQALRILRSLVRGFVLDEVMDLFFDPASYNESYDNAIEMFIAGLPVLLAQYQDRNKRTWGGIAREPEPSPHSTTSIGSF
jgi:Tetracyclin repressor-like, C-terminal domain